MGRRKGYSYYGQVSSVGINIVIKTDYERPTAFGVNYASISLPASCYKDEVFSPFEGQYVFIQVYWVDGQWNPEYEVYDSRTCENTVLETRDGLKR